MECKYGRPFLLLGNLDFHLTRWFPLIKVGGTNGFLSLRLPPIFDRTLMFTNIHGHAKVTEYLRHLVDSEEDLPSSFLFYGPNGVGKRTLALTFAKLLNCKGVRTANCQCTSCRKIDGGHHLDVHTYEPDGNVFKIDQVRELLNVSDHQRMEGRYRVFILEKAHLLNAQAADALLKTLEEGRSHTIFILLSSSKSDIIPTLVGRSMDFYLGYLRQEEVLSVLRDLGYAGDVAKEVAPLASGSVKTALFYLEGSGYEMRSSAMEILSKYPDIDDYLILEEVSRYQEGLGDLVEVLYSLVSDMCQLHRGLTTHLRNKDYADRLSPVVKAFGSKCFNAYYHLHSLRERGRHSVAFEHHVKATLLDLKDVVRA